MKRTALFSGTRRMAGLAAAVLLGGVIGCSSGERRPSSANEGEWRRRAEASEAADHPDSALVAYREAARRYPTTSWPWGGIGRTSARLGRFDEAADAFRSAVRWDSAAIDERVQLAAIMLAEGHPDDSLPWLDEAARIRAEDASRFALRARVLAALGRRGEGRAAVQRAFVLAPDDPEVWAASAFCRAADDSSDAALAELADAIRRHPDEPCLYEERARILEARRDVDGAIRELTRVLSADPRRPRARRRLVALLVGAGRLAEAEPQYRRLLEDNPADVVALDGVGASALARGEPEVAEEAFRRAIASDPEFAPPYLSLGRFLAASGRREEAVDLLRKARARTVGDVERWADCSVALGDTYLDLGEAANALEVADAVLERVPDSADARDVRGRALAAGGGGPASGEELERVLAGPDVAPSDVRAWAQWLLRRGEASRALATLDSLLAEHRDDAKAVVLRAEALVATGKKAAAERALADLVAGGNAPADAQAMLAHLRGEAAFDRSDFEGARLEFERERTLRPDGADAYLALGRIETQLGRSYSATSLFERAAELDPKSALPWWHLGQVREQAGDASAAIGAYRAALERDETSVEAHTRLAWLLCEGDVDLLQAETHASRAAQLAPDNADAQAARGWALEKNGRLDEAATALQRAVALAPREARTQYLLGVVQMQRGRTDDARAALRRALALDPSFDRAADAKQLLDRLGR